ncbi:hypothetical protein A1507_11540 [Methylomonas koyamae]|uniref:Uncharacterized protein n=1 Tax=Methylomonas koyamae TaxID=702114 RepID=A0A177NFL7_9GAMM|nr:hypothetical protein A1507_11540 [Methylomonas koyamae]
MCATDIIGELGIAAAVAGFLQLLQQLQSGPSFPFGAIAIGNQCAFELIFKRGSFGRLYILGRSRRAISLMDNLSRKHIRRIFENKITVSTFLIKCLSKFWTGQVL